GEWSSDVCSSDLFRQPLSHDARHDVGRPAGREAHDDVDRPGWIGLRHCSSQDGRHYGCARGHLQKSSTGKFHLVLRMSLILQAPAHDTMADCAEYLKRTV